MINLYIIDIKEGSSSAYGIGTYLKGLQYSLRQSNLRVCMIHLKSDAQRFTEKIENGITHWYVPLPKIKYRDAEKYNKFYFSNIIFFLRQYIQPSGQTVFHLNASDYPYFSDSLKKTFKCKVVHTVHYLSWCFLLLGNMSRLKNIIDMDETQLDKLGGRVKKTFLDEKKLFNSIDHVICLSNYAYQIFQDIYGVKKQNLSVIYNGLEDNNSVHDRLVLRQKYHIPDVPVILFAGRLADVKGLQYALQAFRKVLRTETPCHFIIAGNGEFDSYMKECEDAWMHISWTGLIGKDKLYDLYSIADIGVMPSFHEQCSYVAIEMMMHGLPLIASTSTGLREMVEDGITGFHIPVVEHPEQMEIDTELLSEKMLYLLQNPLERQGMGRNARKRYEQLYTSEIMRENMLNFYETLK